VDDLGSLGLERAELCVDGRGLLDDLLEGGDNALVVEGLGLLEASELLGGGLEVREGSLDAVESGDGEVVSRRDQGLGARDDGLGGLESARGEAEDGLVEVGGDLGRLDELPAGVSDCPGCEGRCDSLGVNDRVVDDGDRVDTVDDLEVWGGQRVSL
jgi:uncharacterized Zn ribbon protein